MRTRLFSMNCTRPLLEMEMECALIINKDKQYIEEDKHLYVRFCCGNFCELLIKTSKKAIKNLYNSPARQCALHNNYLFFLYQYVWIHAQMIAFTKG